MTWDSIDLVPILAAANVDDEIAELIELIEYRPAVFSEARRQVDGVIGYFRGILSFTELSHPWTFGLATIALRIGEFQAMHYKAKFNRPRASTLAVWRKRWRRCAISAVCPGLTRWRATHATRCGLCAAVPPSPESPS